MYYPFKKLCLTLILATATVLTQANAQNFWHKTTNNAIDVDTKTERNFMPSEYHLYQLNLSALKQVLIGAPVRGINTSSSLIISFPTPEGTLEKYRVMESPIMHADLAKRYPLIKTYVAQGVDDPTAYMRFSITPQGLHTMCLSGKRGATYIDPYTTDANNYLVYDRSTIGTDPFPFECSTPNGASLPSLENEGKIKVNKAVDDKKIRTFRLAQTCTAQYGNLFGTTPGSEKADIQAQMAITINRVNTVYEVDLGISLEFIANNNVCIFYGATNSDPWGNEFNTTTQNFLNATLNNNDYDIGHNFNTNTGGNAGCIGCVCVNGQKGSGMTGRTNPTGDPFDIDYVAHEMGHQFGGYHTMNTCNRSGSGQTEVEPASGSSVMGYAGICATNVQGNSDAHFNYVNIRDISQNIKTGNSTCARVTTISNNPPTAQAGPDFNIPKSTAFVLEGSATDPEGLASLTYNWSQNDPSRAPSNSSPQSTWTSAPLYRSRMPVTSPNRYMPKILDIILGNLTPTWEKTPSVGRILNFSFVVRDNDINGGQTDDDLMRVYVANAAGPFEVTSQANFGVVWNENARETVTWDVANTTASPVSTPNVDIFLSTDGGFTYPITLASGVPNNGSATITVPTGNLTNKARVMVRGAGNIFFAINSRNFEIDVSTGISELNADAIKIYPNPTATILNVTLNPNITIQQIKLSDVQGKAVYEQSNLPTNKLQIDLSNFSKGLYTLEIKTQNGTNRHKIIKQ